MSMIGRKSACIFLLTLIARGSGPVDAAAEEESAVLKPKPATALPDGWEGPQSAGNFSGQVTGPTGAPLPGARVYMAPLGNDDHGQPYASSRRFMAKIEFGPGGELAVRAVTDDLGRFSFHAADMTYVDYDGLPARKRGLLVATADGYGPDWIECTGRPANSTSTTRSDTWSNIELQLPLDDAPLRGRFFGPDGRPLAGARVRLNQIMIPERGDLDHHLDHEVKASLLENGPGYERSLTRPQAVPGLAVETWTDADGRFALFGVGRDRFAQLTVSAPSVVDTTIRVMTRDVLDVQVRQGDTGLAPDPQLRQVVHGAGFTLQLKPGRTVRGRVIDYETGEPIAGMWVGPKQASWMGVSEEVYPWVSDADGRFTITGLSPLQHGIVIAAVAPPGAAYQTAGAAIAGDKEIQIECPRAIAYRLRVVDEQGRAVEAEATYEALWPNPHFKNLIPRHEHGDWPHTPAAPVGDGVYEGFVLPGPGAVLVKTPLHAGYRSAFVDPLAFFNADGRYDEMIQEKSNAFGDSDVLSKINGQIAQDEYAAIVLVNPPPGSAPLELTATIASDKPRQVSLIDSDGKPVVDATTYGMTFRRDQEPTLRAATFPLRRLNPERAQHLLFVHEHRQLIGLLQARGDGEDPYVVRMQKWATVTGRFVDDEGTPVANVGLSVKPERPYLAVYRGAKSDRDGRFAISKLASGHPYRATIHYHWRVVEDSDNSVKQTVFDDLLVGGGEVYDLGDIRIRRHTKD